MGFMISSVPMNMRFLSSSAGQFLMNLFGFLPAPYVLGYMNIKYG